jgi:membrane fusion protein, multidrug efflux system
MKSGIKRRIRGASILLGLPIAGIIACGQTASKPIGLETPQETVVVRLAPVAKRNVASSLIVSGVIGSETEARLSFKTGGVIERMTVREGDKVLRGQLLAALDLTEINAQVEQAKEGMDKAQRDLERARDLFADKVATQEQLDNATTAWNMARQSLGIARFNQSRSDIVAPASGVILRKLMNEGELAAPGMPVLLFAGDGARDWVLRCGVSDRNWARLAKGDRATIDFDAFPGETFQGVVDRLSQSADAASGLYQVEVKMLPGTRDLVAGIFGTGMVETGGNGDGLSVPVETLVEGRGDQAKVFVARKGSAIAVDVKVLELGDAFAVVSGELSVGDSVIVRGAAYLRDVIRIRTAE